MKLHTPFSPLRILGFRVAALGFLAGSASVPTLFADALKCDVSNYKAATGLTAAVAQDVLTVTWTGEANTELRARYVIDHGQPVVRELAVRPAGGAWAVLGENLAPDFTVQTGKRRIDFAGLAPLKLLGIDTASRAVIEQQG